MSKLRCYLFFTLATLNLYPSVVSAQVQITKLDDLSFGAWNGTGDMEQTDEVCVYNSAGIDYQISVTSGGTYRMTSGANNLNFEVRFQNFLLAHGTRYTFTGANTSSATCSGGTNATLKVTVTESALSAAKAGNYSGTLSLLLEPN